MLEFRTCSPAETETLGARLGSLLRSGDMITLSGELGGGKTCLVRGIVKGAAPASADQVASPTYALLHQYGDRPPIYHFDCYRLRGADDALEIGLTDLLSGDGICLIEWPERVTSELPPDRLEITCEYIDDSCRRICLLAHGNRARELLSLLAQVP